jgi:signal transduction histidine kinase
MSRLLPNSLFGQTLLILLSGLVVSHLIGAWIYTSDREQAVRAIGGLTMAQRVANVTRLVEEAPTDWRERIVAASSDPAFRIALTAQTPPFAGANGEAPIARIIRDFLADRLSATAPGQVRVAISAASGAPLAPPLARMHHHPMSRGPMWHAAGVWRGLQIAVQLADGTWLSFSTALPDTGPAMEWQFIASMVVMAVIILAVSVWAVRRVTTPLAEIAAAAQRLGTDVDAPPLAEIGSAEMRRAARVFNEMQERLRRLVENRTRMLAAISHDLRTPLTLLRLRAETVENLDEQERMLATIAEMDAMIAATLAFSREEATAEPRRPTDVTALLASIVDDLADAGMPVTMEPAAPVVCDCRPAALRRAVSNLIDNAVNYGKTAHVAIRSAPRTVTITIDDAGPGIPEPELTRVFQPFYRLEGSRSRETGGAGLGLAIALSIVEAHGGDLTLANRPEGGLRARITLPR